MARSSKVEACLFCGEVPCVCNAKPKKKVQPKPKAPKAEKARPPAPKVDTSPQCPSTADRMRTAMSAQAARRGVPVPSTDATPVPSPVAQPRVGLRNTEDLVFEECIRTLGPLLAEEEQEKYKMILTSQHSPAEKAEIWKWRRQHGKLA